MIVTGQVPIAHIKDEFVADPAKLCIDTWAMKLIGRAHGPGTHLRNIHTFAMDRGAFDPDRPAGCAPDATPFGELA